MEVFSLKFFEGNNIKRQKKVVRVYIDSSMGVNINAYLKKYFRICFSLGFKEKLISVEKDKTICLWVTYNEENVAKYILTNLYYGSLSVEKIAHKASQLVFKGFVNYIVNRSQLFDIPCIRLTDRLFQLGYGKNSTIISEDYQSFENMHNTVISMDREALWDMLRYSNFPRISGKVVYSDKEIKYFKDYTFPISVRCVDKKYDINIYANNEHELQTLMKNMIDEYGKIFICELGIDYRCICFNGNVQLIYSINDEKYSREDCENSNIGVDIKNLCMNIYKELNIKFMYVDIKKSYIFRVVDVGAVFNIADKVNNSSIKVELADCLLKCLKKEGIGYIPIISITGTNGKTTTARLTYNLLNKLGMHAALTSTEGIFIGNKKVRNGDTTGFLSAREVLKNKEVEAAVFETARGGILKNGLGYDKASAGIITCISKDHIGMDGIKGLKELIEVKSVVLDEVGVGGKIIVKAQESLISAAFREFEYCINRVYKRYRKRATSNEIVLFALDKNIYLEEYIEDGGEALYVENDSIIYCKNGVERKIINIKEIPFTHKGISKGNILNIMASIAAISSIINDIEKIVEAIKDIKCDLHANPGRQNILDMGKFKLILDYGHNPEAFTEVFSLVKSLNPSRITSIIAAPGDRMDSLIKELGTIAAKYSDYIIVREQEDLRGRKKGHSASLIKAGIHETGFNKEMVTTIYKEEEALEYAMKKAEKEEVIVLFTQCLDVIIPIINKYLHSIGREKVCE
ncbi:Mur ligase family protein [Clostridium sp. DJ247]|uniref:Mur ligase family protein n=1 Tax=Clostridium sp. DJ247 TaxID=2726188 RepID=UPI0016242338|nr:Mur ligase family protein [Clostridium sp. DJ247]MBC2581282.1 hypothetical protein [Clostridium sp. DJ247]